jgi:hypothetical protein
MVTQHQQINSYIRFILEDKKMVETPKIDPKKEKMARQILYLGLWVVPIPFFNDVINYVVKKYNFTCMSKCMTQSKHPKNVCFHQCSYLAAKYAVDILNKNLNKCNKADDPIKCKNKVYKLLGDWKQREVEEKIRLDTEIKNENRKKNLERYKASRGT